MPFPNVVTGLLSSRMKALHVPTLEHCDRPLDLESSVCESQQNGNARSGGQASINQTKIDLLAMEAFPSRKSLQILLVSVSVSHKSCTFGCIVACRKAKVQKANAFEQREKVVEEEARVCSSVCLCESCELFTESLRIPC